MFDRKLTKAINQDLANCYLKHYETNENLTQTVSVYENLLFACNDNLVKTVALCALNTLAVLYEQDRGTQLDHQEAIRIFNLTAEAGSPEAQNRLGSIFETGLLGTKNCRLAF